MRLWSLHPKYLDVKGLLALWREGLLAQNVLLDKTRGYKNHPQLVRFRETANPVGAMASYLRAVVAEAEQRGYAFDKSKIVKRRYTSRIAVTAGQLDYELQHLLQKLARRDKERFRELKMASKIVLHPMFVRVKGPVADWERVTDS